MRRSMALSRCFPVASSEPEEASSRCDSRSSRCNARSFLSSSASDLGSSSATALAFLDCGGGGGCGRGGLEVW